MRLLITSTLLTICLTAIGQTYPVDTEIKYTDSTGNSVIIQNSYPRAGGDADEKCRYTDSTGKKYTYAIFWSRVINETATPVELTINFPADSFAIPPLPDSYLKLFLPPDTMTLDKEGLYAYGATGLKSFLDTDFNKTMLKRTINPKEEYLFYIVKLSPLYHVGGVVRTGFTLKEQDLYYRISITPNFSPALIPCGQIVFKKLRR